MTTATSNEPKLFTVQIVCSECGRVMGTKLSAVNIPSHGACDPCKADFIARAKAFAK